ncbi:hypothetical protein ACA910_022574 [Epithemia clementina (nom. ined.)]
MLCSGWIFLPPSRRTSKFVKDGATAFGKASQQADNRTKLALRLLHQHNFSILQQQEERPEEEQVEHQHLPGIPVEWDDCLLQSTHNVGMGATMAALAKEVATCDHATLVQVVGPDSHVRAILKDAMMADVVEKAITTPKPTKNIHYL